VRLHNLGFKLESTNFNLGFTIYASAPPLNPLPSSPSDEGLRREVFHRLSQFKHGGDLRLAVSHLGSRTESLSFSQYAGAGTLAIISRSCGWDYDMHVANKECDLRRKVVTGFKLGLSDPTSRPQNIGSTC
jgi:hypothetical protein